MEDWYTANEIDIRTYGGYGTYKVTVTYSDGTSATCEVSNQLTIVQMTQNSTAAPSQTICGVATATIAIELLKEPFIIKGSFFLIGYLILADR